MSIHQLILTAFIGICMIAAASAYEKWWWQLYIINETDKEVEIGNIREDWGKLYDCADTDGWKDEATPKPEDLKVAPGVQKATFCACGRADSASGTDGTFSIYVEREEIASGYWDSPNSGNNKFTLTGKAGAKYAAVAKSHISQAGALGIMNVAVHAIKTII